MLKNCFFSIIEICSKKFLEATKAVLELKEPGWASGPEARPVTHLPLPLRPIRQAPVNSLGAVGLAQGALGHCLELSKLASSPVRGAAAQLEGSEAQGGARSCASPGRGTCADLGVGHDFQGETSDSKETPECR